MTLLRLIALLCTLAALPAQAQDFVTTPDGPISDDDFYNLVSCAAPPGETCAQKRYSWPRNSVISVGILTRDRAYLGGKMKRADASLIRAVKALNAVGLPLSLRITAARAPDIGIHLLDMPRGEKVTDTGIPGLDGVKVGNAATRLFVKNGTIFGAAIVFTRDLKISSYESVMLEELTQSLGLITDIRNPWYETRSIFSQDAPNRLKHLGVQDIMALHRHYP